MTVAVLAGTLMLAAAVVVAGFALTSRSLSEVGGGEPPRANAIRPVPAGSARPSAPASALPSGVPSEEQATSPVRQITPTPARSSKSPLSRKVKEHGVKPTRQPPTTAVTPSPEREPGDDVVTTLNATHPPVGHSPTPTHTKKKKHRRQNPRPTPQESLDFDR